MIVLVSEPDSALQDLPELLMDAGHTLTVVTRASKVLDQAAEREPKLIIADVDLTDMDGYELQASYGELFPHRATPIVLLCDLSTPRDIVRSLEAGTHEYVAKPIALAVLMAKVTRLLESREDPTGAEPSSATLEGELRELPFSEVVDFCREGALTGEVTVHTRDGSTTVPFYAGEPTFADEGRGRARLAALNALSKGSFVVQARALSASELPEAQRPIGTNKDRPPASRPPGKLSGLKLGQRTLHVQTDYEDSKSEQISTVVLIDGQVRTKTTSYPPPKAERGVLERYIEQQHSEVEASVQAKLAQIREKRTGDPSAPPAPDAPSTDAAEEPPAPLLPLVRARCGRGDYEGALKLIEEQPEALRREPLLRVYFDFARKKIDSP